MLAQAAWQKLAHACKQCLDQGPASCKFCEPQRGAPLPRVTTLRLCDTSMSMANTNFETASHYRDNRASNVTLLQAHAFDHYTGRCPGHSASGGIPNPPVNRDMACPICGDVKGLNEFTEDHCPQKSAQSTFGPPACVVRVCATCNNDAGLKFESTGAEVRRGNRASENNVAIVGVDRDSRRLEMSGNAELAMDLKSAFLIAFVSLGYSFALGRSLEPIRRAILAGEAPPVGGPVDMNSDFPAHTVGLLASGGVIISGPSGTRLWWLPCGEDAPTQRLGSDRFRPFGWPNTVAGGNRRETNGLLQQGFFFHADFCANEEHHAELGPRRSAPWTL